MANTGMTAAYLNVICDWAGFAKDVEGSTRVVFPCIQDTRAILAGSGVPDAITNAELSRRADALLNSKELYYNPGSKGKYSDKLEAYLDYVVFKDADKAAQNLVDEKYKVVEKSGERYRQVKKDALKDYKEDEDPSKGTFSLWSSINYPALAAALAGSTQASREYAQAQVATGVPQANQLKKYKGQFETMNAATSAIPGLTMACKDGSVFDIQNYVEELRKNGKVTRAPEPTDVFYQPAFSLSANYAQLLDDYCRDFDAMGFDAAVELDDSTHSEQAAKRAGREVTSVEGSFSIGWLRFSTSHNETKEWSDSSASSKDSGTKVSISCKKKWVVDVSPATKWDVPNFRGLFPYVRDGAPAEIKNLVRPTQLLVGVGVKYTIQISEATSSKFDTEFTKAKGTGAQLSVFGINVDLNHSPERTNESTHKADWNSSTRTLTVAPTNIAGCCTLLAVIGDMGSV